MDLLSSQTVQALLDWRVAIDVLTIALVIFFLYHTLRTTGTWKIALGMMIAAIFFMVARVLELRGIEWIYSNVSQVLLLGLIIIFQPEIRKIFERAASIRPKEAVKEGTKIATTVGDAVLALVQKRRGAIIVFAGKDALQSWISTGIPLDAKLSYPILMSIFDPNSPGHDGAVIIENGLIRTFGARLPLSKVGSLSEELGTRHHASAGLAEVTDALVITVSEERQTVTVFSQRDAQEFTDKNALILRIVRHLDSTSSFEMPWWHRKKRQVLFIELAVSLVLALIFWSTVILTQIEN